VDNKVTRRVAIGTIIGGVVAAPFVIYAWKVSRTVKPPRGKFQKEWADMVKTLDVPIKEIDGPSTFTLDFRPQVGMKFRAISLDAIYEEDSYLAEYPQLPEFYIISNGQVKAISPIVGNKPALLVTAEKQTVRARNYFKEEPGGECVVVPKKDNDGVDYYEAGHGAPKKIPIEKVNRACMNLGSSLAFNYPIGKTLAKGMKWTIPRTANNSQELPCEIVGFAEVAGRETAKMMVERHLNNQEIQDRINGYIQQEKEEKQRTSWKTYLERIIKEERTEIIYITSYVDLKTGLNVRYEWKYMTHIPKEPKKDSTYIIISQVLEG